MKETVTIIRPSKKYLLPGLREFRDYGELIFFLIWKSIKIKYKQTVIGVAWAVIQPLLAMVIFSIFFGRLARIPSDGIPYPIFAYCALVIWTYFSNSLLNATTSLVDNQNLITKVYFPKIFLIISSVIGNLVDFIMAFIILLLMMPFYGIYPSLYTLPLLLIFTGVAVITAFAFGLWLSALNVKYRDVKYVLGFLIQMWFFATPIAYASSLVPDKWKILYGLNPMVGVVEGFRWVLFKTAVPDIPMMAASLFITLVFLFSGLLYFKKMEMTFADIV